MPVTSPGVYVVPQSPGRAKVTALVASPLQRGSPVSPLPVAVVAASPQSPRLPSPPSGARSSRVTAAACAASSAAVGSLDFSSSAARSSIEAKFRDVVEEQVLQLAVTLDQAFEHRLHAMEQRLLDVELRCSTASAVGAGSPSAAHDVLATVQNQVASVVMNRLDVAHREVDGAISRGVADFRKFVTRQQEEELTKLEERMRQEYQRAQGLLQQIQAQLTAVKPFVGVVQRVEEQQRSLEEAILCLQGMSQRMLKQARSDRRVPCGAASEEHASPRAAAQAAAAATAAAAAALRPQRRGAALVEGPEAALFHKVATSHEAVASESAHNGTPRRAGGPSFSPGHRG